jgi:GH3 auxin-responsive promoter
MKDFVRSALHWLADRRLARRVVESLFRARARQPLVDLDQQSVARCQRRTLLGLVHRAHTTRFGRDHDFRRIRTVSDFRRLVPLRTPAELWRDYWQPAFPNFGNATWPGPIPYLAISAVSPGGFPYLPVSADLWAAQQTAALTALAFILHARPKARFCSGRLLLLGGGTTLYPIREGEPAECIETIAIRKLPALLRPYALAEAPPAADAAEHEPWLADVANRSLQTSVTCLAGTTDRLVRLLECVRRRSGCDRITKIWPTLTAILHAGGHIESLSAGGAAADATARRRLEETVADGRVLLLEMYSRPEGTLAIEDPRHSRLRLLPDHGVYFEFVPVDQVGTLRPERLSAAEVELGVPYALALSSPAGIWACLVGSVVRFESRQPPLLQVVETEHLWDRPAPSAVLVGRETNPPHPFPVQPPHRRRAGKAAALRGTFVHSAW